MLILGIETSCDDTGISIIKVSEKQKPIFEILSNVVSSQIKVHAKYGGVVPNLAAREHLKNIEPCIKQAFNETKIVPTQIDLMAVTVGPGLIPSLLIGVNFAKTLTYVWKKPIIGINHIEAHILANWLINPETVEFPALALVVSGGHTQLIFMKNIGNYKILGETRDDAAGECFDKVAKLLNLGYPGGPKIAEQATNFRPEADPPRAGNFQLPRPMINHKNYDFSFSGLKTAVLYLVKSQISNLPGLAKRSGAGKSQKFIQELCHETQQAIIDVLIEKTLRAAKEYKAKTIILTGGVAANEELRNQLNVKCQLLRVNFLVPPKNLCTDNGAMVAMAGYFGARRHPASRDKYSWRKIKADANLRIG